MPIIITLTNSNVPNHIDRILKNIHNDDYELYYCGQNQGIFDYQIVESINNQEEFRIYFREMPNNPFRYLGSTHLSRVIQHRQIPVGRGYNAENYDKLQIHLLIQSDNIVNTIVPENNFNGSGKYKKDVFVHSNIDVNRNTNIGFYKY